MRAPSGTGESGARSPASGSSRGGTERRGPRATRAPARRSKVRGPPCRRSARASTSRRRRVLARAARSRSARVVRRTARGRQGRRRPRLAGDGRATAKETTGTAACRRTPRAPPAEPRRRRPPDPAASAQHGGDPAPAAAPRQGGREAPAAAAAAASRRTRATARAARRLATRRRSPRGRDQGERNHRGHEGPPAQGRPSTPGAKQRDRRSRAARQDRPRQADSAPGPLRWNAGVRPAAGAADSRARAGQSGAGGAGTGRPAPAGGRRSARHPVGRPSACRPGPIGTSDRAGEGLDHARDHPALAAQRPYAGLRARNSTRRAGRRRRVVPVGVLAEQRLVERSACRRASGERLDRLRGSERTAR